MKTLGKNNTLTAMPFEQVLIRSFSNEIQLRAEFVIFFILEGTMSVNIYENTISLNPHDILFIKPFEIHNVQDTSADIHVLALLIQSDFLSSFCPNIEEIYFESHHIRYSQSNPAYTGICSALSDIILYTIKSDSAARLKLLSSITSILTTLLNAYGSKQLNPPENSSYLNRQLQLLLDYLNTNYMEKITLSSAAEVLGFHPQYFSVFFKKHFHTTFIEYLTMLRVNKTLPLLANTNESITDIALNNGFSNHKTYNAAFRKTHGITPTTYRKNSILSNQNGVLNEQNMDYFSFFQQYWQPDSSPNNPTRSLQNHMTLNLPALNDILEEQPFPNIHCFSVGQASSLLRNDIQSQIRDAHGELSIDMLRLRNIFSDDLYIYYEDEEKRPVINWKYIDIIFDFLLNLGIKPFPEIGFMPRELASKKQYASWLYRPNISLPKSFKKWSTLLTSFIEHLIARYGREEVLSWNFDFWATPNLNFRDSYWNESKEDFFLFYRISYFSLKNVEPELRIGTPDFSLPNGLSWYDDFFEYCSQYDLHPSYVALHLYNCNDYISPNQEKLTRFSDSWDSMSFLNVSKDTIVENVTALKKLLEERHLTQLPLIVSNWNLSFLPRDLVRDTSFMAPFILYTTSQISSSIDTMCFHSLSDITEDFFIDQKPLHGGPGLMDYNGLKKASYYAFLLLSKMENRLIDVGENYLMTKSSKGYQLLLFHYVYYDSLYSIDDHSSLAYKQRYNIYESSEELAIHSIIPAPEGRYSIKETRLNRQQGSVYDLWMECGAPEEMDSEMIAYLSRKSYPDISYYIEESTGNLVLDTVLPPHGVVLLEITPQ